MRLTLRTMLAYLDDILEPADFQDISQKIAESEFATNLVHRTRDVTRRLRLGAPKVSGRGMGLDPNTVAEYLDNTLAADRVPDFEKVCLESDVHLAEVTACHQILTLVLGEPAHVDPAMRRRLYHVGSEMSHTADLAHHDAPAAAAHAEHHAAPPPLPFVPIREKPVVPDYLRESTKSRWRTGILSAVAAAVVLGAIVMALGGPKDVLKIIGIGPPQVIELPPANFTDTPAKPAMPAPSDVAVAPANEPPQTPADNIVPDAILPPANIAPPADIAASDAPQPELRQPIPSGPPETGPPPALGDPTQPPTITQPTTPPGAAAGAMTGPVPGVTTMPPAVVTPATDRPPTPSVFNGNDDAVARLVSDEEVLLRYDPTANAWRRLASRALLARGDKLLALPTFRPAILLSSNLNVQIVPETLIELVGADGDGVLGINVLYGRIVLLNKGGNSELRLRLGEQQGTLTFAGDAVMAAEVRPFRMAGINPESQLAPAAVDLYCTSGQVTWTEASGGEAKTLTSPARLVVVPHPGEAIEATKELPKWIASNQITPLEERASRTFYKALDDQNILLKLKELAGSPRAENRSLAIRCLAHLGQFDEFVEVLNDPDQQSAWAAYTDAVEAALARGPDAAGKVRAAFEKKAGDKGGELYRMLWGYTPADLEAGGAVTLVEYLDHEDLPYRVLAFWNLKSITGSTLTYRPDAPPMVRRPAVQRWRDRLREGQIITKPAVPPKRPGTTDAPPG